MAIEHIFESSTCWKCKEPMRFVEGRIEHARKSGTALHCPFGNANYWNIGKSDSEKLKEQLEAERRERQRAEQRVAEYADEAKRERNRANGYKGHATRITKRAKAGVCPCCNRTFKQLAAHMATQHPQFTPIDIDQVPTGKIQ